jgi:protein TonB
MKYFSIFLTLFFFCNLSYSQTYAEPVTVKRVEVVEVMEEEEDVDVPFIIIEVAPIYPGCKPITREESMACFKDKLLEKFHKAFVFPSHLEKTPQKIFVSFRISKEGFIQVTNMRAGHKEVEALVRKIFSDLPQMFPGTQRGRPVDVSLTLPIMINQD